MNKNVWTFGGTIKLTTAGCHFARSHSGPALFTPTHLSSRMPLATRGLAVILDSWLDMIELPTLKKLTFLLLWCHFVRYLVDYWTGYYGFFLCCLKWNWVTHQRIVYLSRLIPRVSRNPSVEHMFRPLWEQLRGSVTLWVVPSCCLEQCVCPSSCLLEKRF